VWKGTQVQIQVTITGTDQPQNVDLYCTTPHIVTFKGGAIHQKVKTSGGTPNTVTLPIQTHQVGEFHVQGIIRGQDPETDQWLEVDPPELVCSAGDTITLSVYLVKETRRRIQREEIQPESVFLDPVAGRAGWRGDLTVRLPGRHLVVVEAEGMQLLLEMIVQ